MKEEVQEFGKFMKSCFTEFIPSSKNYKLKGSCWLDDPHTHYFRVDNKKELEELLENMTSKLGRTAITDWRERVKGVLKYKEFVSALKEYSSSDNNLAIQDKGPVSIISYKGNRTEIYPSQEIRTKSHLHITAEGCINQMEDNIDPRKTVEMIHKNGGIAIVEHPATKCHSLFQYIYTNKDDDRLTLEVFEMADAAEVFNSYNTLWMCISNANAKQLAENMDVAKIAGSDSHFGLSDNLTKILFYRNMGKTGIYLPIRDNSGLTGAEIINQKKNYLKQGRYERLENYTGPLTFFMSMVPPIVARKLNLNNDSIS